VYKLMFCTFITCMCDDDDDGGGGGGFQTALRVVSLLE